MVEVHPENGQSVGELRRELTERNPEFRKAAETRREFEQMLLVLRRAMRDTRKRQKVSQGELAAKMATTQSAISAIENGPGDLGVLTLVRYLTGVGVEPAIWLRENAPKLQPEAAEAFGEPAVF